MVENQGEFLQGLHHFQKMIAAYFPVMMLADGKPWGVHNKIIPLFRWCDRYLMLFLLSPLSSSKKCYFSGNMADALYCFIFFLFLIYNLVPRVFIVLTQVMKSGFKLLFSQKIDI